MRAEIIPGRKSEEIACTSMAMANRGAWIPEAQKVEYFVSREEAGVRRFDVSLACWVREMPETPPEVRPGPAVTPGNDGSGVWWDIRDRSGQMMWRVESYEFPLGEKRRLCAASGAKSGWAFITASREPK